MCRKPPTLQHPHGTRTLKRPDSKPFEITIDKLVYGGYGLGRHQGKVVLVPFSAPGDRLLVRAVTEKKNLIRAEVAQIIAGGYARNEPRCSHFGRCGGCQWQHLDYAQQVATKRQILEELFHHRFPQSRNLAIEMMASPEIYNYRSRARLQVRCYGSNSEIGFYRSQSHIIEDIESCPLLRPSLNRALGEIRRSEFRGGFYQSAKELEIAGSEETGEWSAQAVEQGLDESSSSLGKGQDDRREPVFPLKRTVGGFTYKLLPSAFFQANDFLITALADTVLGLAKSSGRASALDLFSGVGLFSLPLARHFVKVTAVENSPVAAHLCAENAKAAAVDNLRISQLDVLDWMRAVGSISPPAFDVVVLDPPRTGAGADVMEHLREWAPETIIYVSCDPNTLCRDISFLPTGDYEIDSIKGLDLFPQTYHFETIVRLKRC